MRAYYPKDSNGNIIGFKIPESFVYDENNKILSDKITTYESEISTLKSQVETLTNRINALEELISTTTHYTIK